MPDDCFTPFLSDPDHQLELPATGSWPEAVHCFDRQSIWAIRAALAAGRPLLLRGEPGIGKSQLARAAAEVLGVTFLSHVIDERTERDDLLFQYDAVARLAQAQLLAACRAEKSEDAFKKDMAEGRFLRPGVLWWAIHWASAQKQARGYFRKCPVPEKPKGWRQTKEDLPCGAVVLVDEIDKADPSVPNGLLECLGNTGFDGPQLERAVALPPKAKPPLVMITTNEERELPAAFLRRCLVLHQEFPKGEENARTFLRKRARVWWDEETLSEDVCGEVIDALLGDRAEAERHGLAKPGAAEFLDLAGALVELHEGEENAKEREKQQFESLKEIRDFVLKKHQDAR